MFLSFFCIASEYPHLCNNKLFGGFAPPAAWQISAVFFIVLRLECHCRVLHFYLEIASVTIQRSNIIDNQPFEMIKSIKDRSNISKNK